VGERALQSVPVDEGSDRALQDLRPVNWERGRAHRRRLWRLRHVKDGYHRPIRRHSRRCWLRCRSATRPCLCPGGLQKCAVTPSLARASPDDAGLVQSTRLVCLPLHTHIVRFASQHPHCVFCLFHPPCVFASTHPHCAVCLSTPTLCVLPLSPTLCVCLYTPTLCVLPLNTHIVHFASQHPHCAFCLSTPTLCILPLNTHIVRFASQHPHCAFCLSTPT